VYLGFGFGVDEAVGLVLGAFALGIALGAVFVTITASYRRGK
jgi:hypothetical protein